MTQTRQRVLQYAQRSEIVRLHHECGYSIPKLARMFGVSEATISYHLRVYKLRQLDGK